MSLDETAPVGFTIAATALDQPEPGSVEAAASDAGLGVSLIDLRRAHGDTAAPPGLIAAAVRVGGSPVRVGWFLCLAGMVTTAFRTVAAA
jgi:erythromycin esterase